MRYASPSTEEDPKRRTVGIQGDPQGHGSVKSPYSMPHKSSGRVAPRLLQSDALQWSIILTSAL